MHSGVRKWQLALCLQLLTVLQLYHLPTSLPLSSGTLLACSLDISPCVPALVLNPVLFKYCTVRLKMLSSFFGLFLCIICMESIINLLHYSTV